MRVLSTELLAHVGERVTLAGWVHAKRDLGAVSFLVLRPRWPCSGRPLGGARPAAGDPRRAGGRCGCGSAGPWWRRAARAVVPGALEPAAPPPVELRRPVLKETLPTVLEYAPDRAAPSARAGEFRAGGASLAGFRRELDRRGFTEISTPKIVASATESGANVFALDYFGRPRLSGAEPAALQADDGWRIRTRLRDRAVFRAEPHDTARHLAEYTSLDADGLHPRPLRGHDHRARGARRDGRRDPRTRPTRGRAARSAAGDPVRALRRHRRRGRRPRPGGRAAPLRAARRVAVRHRLSDGEAAVLHPPGTGRPEYSNPFDLLFRGMEIVTGGQRPHVRETTLFPRDLGRLTL
jgi:nondiscriminating aspartyl-tRNA synthetase